ncbi:Acylphosphatase-like domain [Plasmopara halstedii]|uniref:acylphosphatase n=1 Tax=Plasmopara halstedii TaxID=4781 RepID=A0A0P1A9R3_PLAHL|nr:Acylphosphatase-like domain [Plasmopara halstedii]CEG37474.1 Acylphosphatase-like domain [Plasmopara halstedii]|eukprot:XP_024573843.1 Acylphosphatase-like domain [Plasmopara halstedii]
MSSYEQQRGGEVRSRWLEVRGKVQKVMFRQTVIRAMQKRGLEGGASNDRQDKNLVRITMRGNPDQMEEIVTALREGNPINDWGAMATSVEDVDSESGMVMEAHQVTTTTVDNRSWNPNVTMFL